MSEIRCIRGSEVRDLLAQIEAKRQEREARQRKMLAAIIGDAASGSGGRIINPVCVERFMDDMQTGNWHDGDDGSEPGRIVMTTDGEVIDGNHRLEAASQVDWSSAPQDVCFALEVVDPREITVDQE